jgi:hypothetical protein
LEPRLRLLRPTPVRFFRVVVSALCALLGAALLFGTARSRSWGAPVKEIPKTEDGEPFTAITLELPGAPAWMLISSAVAGAIVFGAGGWLLTGLLLRHRLPGQRGDLQVRRQPR